MLVNFHLDKLIYFLTLNNTSIVELLVLKIHSFCCGTPDSVQVHHVLSFFLDENRSQFRPQFTFLSGHKHVMKSKELS